MLKKARIAAKGEEVSIVVNVEFSIDTSPVTGYGKGKAQSMVDERVDNLVREIADMTGVPVFKVKVKG
jgi:hypothetical protein